MGKMCCKNVKVGSDLLNSHKNGGSKADRLVGLLRAKKHFVWDFDGSLCNTESLHYEAYRRAFLEFGHALAEDNYYLDFTHLGEGARKEISKHALSVDLEKILDRKKVHFDKIIREEPLDDFEGIREILSWMRSAGSVCIASNSPASEISIVLARTGLDSSVDFIVGKAAHLRKKPFPDLFQEAHRQLGAPASDSVLVLEDSERGLMAAHAAGLPALLLITRFNDNLSFTAPYSERATHREFQEAVALLSKSSNASTPSLK